MKLRASTWIGQPGLWDRLVQLFKVAMFRRRNVMDVG